jgi:transposase
MSSPDCPRTFFAGFDWAKRSHHVVIVDQAGQRVAEFSFEHTQAGWQQWRQQAARFVPLAVAIETSQGTVVDQLLQTSGYTVFPMNPNAARAYRERKAPRAAPRATTWMPGVLPTPCAWMAPTGSRSQNRIPC